jgi:hypothetical protein
VPWASGRIVPGNSSTTHPSVWCRSTPEIKQISILCQFSTYPGNALVIGTESEICICHYRHRAATTGSTGFVTLLLRPPEGSPKTRLNTGDRMGICFSLCGIWCLAKSEIYQREYSIAPRHGICSWRDSRIAHRSWSRQIARKVSCLL